MKPNLPAAKIEILQLPLSDLYAQGQYLSRATGGRQVRPAILTASSWPRGADKSHETGFDELRCSGFERGRGFAIASNAGSFS